MQFAFAYFHFAQVEHHVNQCFHALRLAIDGFQRLILLVVGANGFQYPFQGSIYQRQRGAQLVADVDEKSYLFLIDLLLVLLHGPLQFAFLAFQHFPEKAYYQQYAQRGRQQYEPPGLVPGRQDGQGKNLPVGNPTAVLGRARSHDAVGTWQLCVHDEFGLVGFCIAVVQSFYAVAVESASEDVFFLGHDLYDDIAVAPYGDGVLILGQLVVDGFSVENDIRQLYFGLTDDICFLVVGYKEQSFHTAHVDALSFDDQL